MMYNLLGCKIFGIYCMRCIDLFESLKRLTRLVLKSYKTQAITFVFLFLIFFGGFLLNLPIASRNGVSMGYLDALFTATSATCVTGLVVVDTYVQFSAFGQLVIIFLIQIGGLGFMTMATLFSLLMRRVITLNERLLIRESLNIDDMQGIVRLAKHILIGTFAIEFVGALLLSIRFIPEFGMPSGIYKSIFHSISAFCNAGFDIMGQKGEFIGLTSYVSDPIVSLVIPMLIIIGGIGFAVWEDVFQQSNFYKLRLHTKIAITMTAFFIISGTIGFYILEHNNPATMQGLSPMGKLLASFFQSVTTRTAGFNTISQDGMTIASKFISIILMFIGGAPGSTAGGIKVVTVGVLAFAAYAVIKGTSQVTMFKRRISYNAILRAMTIVMISLFVVATGIIILSIVEKTLFINIIFEVVSAFGTVGLTLGITPNLTVVGKLTIITIMFFGRVGVLTVALSLLMGMNSGGSDKIKYPEEKIMVG